MTTATEDLLKRANEGDLEAQYTLSLRYYQNGREMNNPRQGYLWMKVAAENGLLKAQKALGLLYSSVQNAPYPNQNPKEAFRMYYLAAQQGDAQAQYWLGRCYLLGFGTEVDEDEAHRWISAAHAKGYEEAEEEIAELYSEEKEAAVGNWEFSAAEPEEGEVKTEKAPLSEEKPRRSPAIVKPHNEETAKRFDPETMKNGLIFGFLGILIGLCVGALINLVFRLLSGGSSLYGLILMIGAVLGAAAGFYYGYAVALQRAKDKTYFRSTPFYSQVGKDYELLDAAGKHAYEVYVRLSKILQPFGCPEDTIGKAAFGSCRGYLFPAVCVPAAEGRTVIDLIAVTEKTIYVFMVSGVHGTISGGAEDVEWQVSSGSGRNRYLNNLLLRNEEKIELLKQVLLKYSSEEIHWENVPVYSVVCFSEEAEIAAMRGLDEEKHQFVLAGSGEKIRSFLEMQESRRTMHSQENDRIVRGIERLLQEEIRRKKKSEKKKR